MDNRAKGRLGKAALLITVAAVACSVFAVAAFAHNLDRRTATNAAKKVAKLDCRNTSGCEDYFVRGLHRVSRHKAVGKIHVISVKNGERFDCKRQLKIKLEPDFRLSYGVSKRRCVSLGLV